LLPKANLKRATHQGTPASTDDGEPFNQFLHQFGIKRTTIKRKRIKTTSNKQKYLGCKRIPVNLTFAPCSS
jgi:hypothetical protein